MTNHLKIDIAGHPFLIGMREDHIRLLTDCAIRTHFAADQIIFREGETADRFYLIEQGEVVLEAAGTGDQQVVIDTVGDGGLLGRSWLVPPYIWHFTARATKPTSAIFFYGTILREYCEKDQTLGFEIFKRMAESDDASTAIRRARFLKAYSEGDTSGSKGLEAK